MMHLQKNRTEKDDVFRQPVQYGAAAGLWSGDIQERVLPLVIGHGHGADSCVTARVAEQLLEVVNLPDRQHSSISTTEQSCGQIHHFLAEHRGHRGPAGGGGILSQGKKLQHTSVATPSCYTRQHQKELLHPAAAPETLHLAAPESRCTQQQRDAPPSSTRTAPPSTRETLHPAAAARVSCSSPESGSKEPGKNMQNYFPVELNQEEIFRSRFSDQGTYVCFYGEGPYANLPYTQTDSDPEHLQYGQGAVLPPPRCQCRVSVVWLALLCLILLAAIALLCVSKNQLLASYVNLTREREQLDAACKPQTLHSGI